MTSCARDDDHDNAGNVTARRIGAVLLVDPRRSSAIVRCMNANPSPTHIAEAHCQSCGSTAAQHISDLRDTEGYTRCCNELVIHHATRGAYGTFASFNQPTRCDDDDTRCYHD